jgi:transcription elongation GreA/GreB family factor
MDRPYFSFSADQLEEAAGKGWENISLLRQISEELAFRKTRRAGRLSHEIRARIEELDVRAREEAATRALADALKGLGFVPENALAELLREKNARIDFLEKRNRDLMAELKQNRARYSATLGDHIVIADPDDPARTLDVVLARRRDNATNVVEGSHAIFVEGTPQAEHLMGAAVGDTVNLANDKDWRIVALNKHLQGISIREIDPS